VFLYLCFEFNGSDLSGDHPMAENNSPTSCRANSRAMPMLALWAGVAAQAWRYHQAVVGTSTMGLGPGHARAVLVPVERA
jgi:hypothetical protein